MPFKKLIVKLHDLQHMFFTGLADSRAWSRFETVAQSITVPALRGRLLAAWRISAGISKCMAVTASLRPKSFVVKVGDKDVLYARAVRKIRREPCRARTHEVPQRPLCAYLMNQTDVKIVADKMILSI
jgi:hypothetical protein